MKHLTMLIRPVRRRLLFVPLICFLSLACIEKLRKDTPGPTIEGTELQLDSIFQGHRSYEHTRYFTQFWRIAGSPSFDSCVNYVKENLIRSGFSLHERDSKTRNPWSIEILEDSPEWKIWVPHRARLMLRSPEERLLLDFAETPLMLCSNSYSRNMSSDLVYVRGGSKPSDFEDHDVKGKVVLCDDPPDRAWSHATGRGALGIISSFVQPFNSPERFPDIISEGSIPLSDSVRSFGLKVSPKIGRDLQKMAESGPVSIHIEITTSFPSAPIKTVVAEISGRVKPDERILFIAHLDHYKPGANDNASGSATLLEISSSVGNAIRSGAIQPPSRTLTFLWVDEYNGTGFWMKRHKNHLSDVRAVFVLDMVGGDPAKTGGRFRIEKMPDPGVLWVRPPDLHSGWGVGQWKEEKLFGSFLNDFMLSVVHGRSSRTGWKTTSNVWEGGSDHDPFLRAGIPAILSWHFPDPFYHSSLDRMENISPAEMNNAGVSIAAAGVVLASGSQSTAERVLNIVVKAAAERMDQMQAQTVVELAEAQHESPEILTAARRQERRILEAWTRWYRQACESVLRIPVEGAAAGLRERVSKESKQLQDRLEMMLLALDLE